VTRTKQMNVKTWLPFEDREKDDLHNESVVSCFLGKVFQFCEWRSVWGPFNDDYGDAREPNWSCTYAGHESFCVDLETALRKINERRKRGSQWVVREHPAVVISGENRSLIIGEINSDVPLSKFLPLRKKLLSLQNYGDYFAPLKQDSVFRILSDSHLIRPAELPFYRRHSRSIGTGSLKWNESPGIQDLRATLRVVCQITKRLQREAACTRH
jgi:hypothetical protein